MNIRARRVPEGRTPQQYLEHLTWEGAKRRWPDGIPDKVDKQLRHELALIEQLDFARYFLTVHDIVDFARSLDPPILCQGRGSAANSAVCFCLGITAVDPATSDLLFERFISEERKRAARHRRRFRARAARGGDPAHLPQIRPRPRRDRRDRDPLPPAHRRSARSARRWASAKTSARRSPAPSGAAWTRELEDERAAEAGLDLGDPHLRRTIELAEQMIGMPRHLSQHVGGFILTERPLTETVPIGNGAMADRTFIEWDKDDIDELGILKIDVLALGMLTCIRKCVRPDRAAPWRAVGAGDRPAGGPGVYDMLCQGDSLGVFQVESRAQMNMLPRLKPRCFYDLVIEVAIVRPGPIQGDMVHPYLKRRSGKEPVTFPCPDARAWPARRARADPRADARRADLPGAGDEDRASTRRKFSPAEANQLRKAMATFRSRGTIEALQDKMVGRMVARGYDPDFAQRCFDQIKGFGEYGFPESHAASFAQLVYVSSWLKWHYPAAFACALLNSQPMGFYAPAQIVRDAREHGVEVRAVDVNQQRWDCTLGARRARRSRLGLRRSKGCAIGRGERTGRGCAATGPTATVEELRTRGRVPVHAIERLAAADAFRSIGLDRRAALWDARALKPAPDLPLFAGRRGARRRRGSRAGAASGDAAQPSMS